PGSVPNPVADPKFSNQLLPSYTTLSPFPVATLGFIAVIESENPLDPYVQTWTLSLERELAKNTTLEVNYVGNHGTHLLDRRQIAQPNDLPAANVAYCAANPTATLASGGQANCAPSSRLPYRNFTGNYIDSDFHGYSHYDAANIKFEHR